jgi:hypothetical protein
LFSFQGQTREVITCEREYYHQKPKTQAIFFTMGEAAQDLAKAIIFFQLSFH